MTPPEWARSNRIYPETAGRPGPRNPDITPYMTPYAMAVHGRTHKRVVMVVSAQSGKSETMLDIIGERLDSSPVPIIYVGPSKQFLSEQWEPRIDDLMTTTSLKDRLGAKSRMTKTRKFINGVPLRLAHGGSSTAMKSDPFGLALTDEADEMMSNVRGAGNPVTLIDARGDTYADFVHAVTSTPSEGVAEVETDPETGLEFWSDSDPEEVKSTIWRLWLSGTRYHWAWPCPHCGEYFIPRFACLEWEKPKDANGRELKSTPAMAKNTAYLQCPQGCADRILEEHKEVMNARGVYVSPGQSVTPDGVVHGQPPESWTLSYWVSGLASPFVTWGERAARYVEAVRSGDPETIKAVKNQGFGELYSPGGGNVPDLDEVRARSIGDYSMGEVLEDVKVLTLTSDVQQDRLIYVIRGWGAGGTSWLVEASELYGRTDELEVWETFQTLLSETYDGLPLRLALVDSGFRPGKKFIVPEHRVYALARRWPNLVRATKGSSTVMRKPIVSSKIDISLNGREIKKGLELIRLDTDYFKSWVQSKIRWESGTPGAWYLPSDISDDYCKQIISESRTVAPGGKVKWIQKSKENHFFDCEAMQGAASMMLNLPLLRDGVVHKRRQDPDPTENNSTEDHSHEERRPSPNRPGSIWGGGSGRSSIW